EVTIAAFLKAEHTQHTEQFIVNSLRKAGQLTVSLVAEVDGHLVGHVGFSPVKISNCDEPWYGVGPVSVLPEWQGKSIGTRLMKQGLDQLRELGATGCVVLGNPNYYQRFGFKAEICLVLEGVPPEYFQAVCFKGDIPSGTVTYHEAFNAQA
ncbi:hypothetical protein K7432_015890, partial [Basidiobolus ranarum]